MTSALVAQKILLEERSIDHEIRDEDVYLNSMSAEAPKGVQSPKGEPKADPHHPHDNSQQQLG